MSNSATGPAAMPGTRSNKAPSFSGKPEERIADFLFDYEGLATGCQLTDKEKVEAILRYVPFPVHELWKTITGYASGDWAAFRATLERLYPDTAAATRYTRNVLKDLVQLSSKYRMRDENDVLEYYRHFLTISNPLVAANQITADDCSAEFFLGFHPDDRNVLESRLFSMKPNQPEHKPYDLEDVFTAAQRYFSDAWFYRLADRRRDDPPAWTEPGCADSGHWMQHLFGREDREPRLPSHDRDLQHERDTFRDRDLPAARRPEYETRTVHLTNPDPRQAAPADEKTELADIINKMHGLSIRDPTYAVLYAQCTLCFPSIAQMIPKPDFFQPTPTTTYQAPVSQPQQHMPTNTLLAEPVSAPARQPWTQPAPSTAAPMDPSLFFRRPPRTTGCAFCALQGHQVRGCPAAEEYVRTGRALIINECLHLPNKQPIPNDGSGRGLKSAIDTWLAANSARPGEPSTVPTQATVTAAFQHTSSSQMALSFEAIQPAIPAAYITEATESCEENDEDGDSLSGELYDMYEVFAAEKKKRETRSSKPPNAAPVPPPTTTVPIPSTSRAPQYRYQSSAEDQKLTNELCTWLLEGKLAQTTPAHILAASAPIRKDLVDRLRTRRVETAASEELSKPPPVSILGITASRTAELSLPLREVDVLVSNKRIVSGVLDNGSQIIAIRADLYHAIGSPPIDKELLLEMEGSNSSTSWTLGCAMNLAMRIGDIDFQVHAHVVKTAPFQLLLGRPFSSLMLSGLQDHEDGRVTLSIQDPCDPSHSATVPTRACGAQVGYINTLAFRIKPAPPRITTLERYTTYAACTTSLQQPTNEPPISTLAYKKVAKKVHPVAASLPEDFWIIQRIPEDPLLSLSPLPTHPPPFTPGTWLTQERLDALNINRYAFLWPEEEKLAQHVLKVNEQALAWTEAERGCFHDDYFSPVKIPTIAHTPWVHKNIPIPTGILDEVIELFKKKIAAGVYEPSDASYRSRWFCVKKKNGSLRIVHDLQPLNAVTIHNAAVPPFVDQFVEGMAARACYSMLDLFVGYDHRSLDVSSCDLTSFQTPLGAYRCTVLPQGSTNAVAIFHGDVTFILEPEIPNVAKPFLDDTAVRGPASRYETPDGGYETIPENAGIRRFVWEHLSDVHRVIHHLGHAGATVSTPKIFIAAPEVIILGHKCTYEGRVPEDSKTAKIRSWPACKTVTDVRAFLGTAGVMWIWIQNYSAITRPLVDLTRKDAEFIWEDQHDQAMEALKDAIITSPALIPINYTSTRPVYLAIDSSWRAVGWILSQQCEDGQRRPSRFGSIAWNERESRYSQPKIELYGLFRTLRALRMHIIGVTNLIIEMDALYVRGMLNNPDVQPNAAMNRWIAAILLFDFKLVHVPAEKHLGPDGLSRREPVLGEDEEDGDPEDWVDEVLSLGIWVDSWQRTQLPIAQIFEVLAGGVPSMAVPASPSPHPSSARDDELERILEFLSNPARQSELTTAEHNQLLKRSRAFFTHNGRLWRRQKQGRHQLVMFPSQRSTTVREAHDNLGHKGYYATLRTILDRFWWPSLAHDVKQHITTCHECQICQTTKVRIPPTIAAPAPLFHKAYIDTMFMPPAAGYRYIVQARCSLSAWPEWRALRSETGRTLAAFIFEDILCRWGAVEEIVTDNGTAFVAALDYLADRHGIRHIRISAYNSRANGIVERQHRTIRESIVKACEGNISKWPTVAPHAFWADCATTRKSTGHSLFFMAHGTEPILPFDITLATFLVPDIAKPLSTTELIAIRTRQLQKREADLATIHDNILRSRFQSVQQFERQYEKTIRDYDFKPGTLVLVRNSSIETDLGRKSKPRYFGPMVVVRRTPNGSYRLAELDSAVSKLRFAAF